MSAKDNLDSFDREWERSKDRKLLQLRASTLEIDLSALPSVLRDRVKKDLESVLAKAIKGLHDEERAKLKEYAINEARRTLEELAPARNPPAEVVV